METSPPFSNLKDKQESELDDDTIGMTSVFSNLLKDKQESESHDDTIGMTSVVDDRA
jgi:hypothetical protein